MTMMTMRDHYSPKEGITFYKGKKYRFRSEMDKSVALWHTDDWFTIPKDFIMSKNQPESIQRLLDQVEVDAWSMIVDRTGIDRQTVKRFFFKYWHEIPIPTICKDEKIRCQDVAHMIAVFNEWADANDPSEG